MPPAWRAISGCSSTMCCHPAASSTTRRPSGSCCSVTVGRSVICLATTVRAAPDASRHRLCAASALARQPVADRSARLGALYPVALWVLREEPDVRAGLVHVVLDAERDPAPTDVVVLVAPRPRHVADQLAVRGVDEQEAVISVLAHEDDARRLVEAAEVRVAPPVVQEAVVAAELVVVLVNAARAVELDEVRPGGEAL